MIDGLTKSAGSLCRLADRSFTPFLPESKRSPPPTEQSVAHGVAGACHACKKAVFAPEVRSLSDGRGSDKGFLGTLSGAFRSNSHEEPHPCLPR